MPITQDFLNQTNGLRFSKTSDIGDYFNARFQKDFITWFRSEIGGKANWQGLTISSNPDTAAGFNRFWQNDYIRLVFSSPGITLLQFLALQSIIINETGGLLRPISEKVNSPEANAHPGIAYAFDAIPNLKHSYNTLSGNKSCLKLFNDADYLAQFGGKALGAALAHTNDPVWAGELYPAATYSVSTAEADAGFVLEADFYKFRGRGLIQTTSRGGYKDIIGFVLAYAGANQAVAGAKANWGVWGANQDVVATRSSNADWDGLFMNSDLLVASQGIYLHNKGHGNYLGTIDGSTPDKAGTTIQNVGKRVSGGTAYSKRFLARVVQLIEALS